MALKHGEHITGAILERETSDWEPCKFTSLCDALVWAIDSRRVSGLPNYTSRVNAKDGGIDASFNIAHDEKIVFSHFLTNGLNIFQYKLRDKFTSSRSQVISNLKSGLKGAVEKLSEKPDRYILFTNIELKGSDKQALKESIADNRSPGDIDLIQIVGAAELASFLNNCPHIRAAYFGRLSFQTWQSKYDSELRRKEYYGGDVPLIGRDEELEELTKLILDPKVKAIVVYGEHDIGKTRLIQEATEKRKDDVVYALDPSSLSFLDYERLCPNRGEAICVVEDAPLDSIKSLTDFALQQSHIKTIFCAPLANGADLTGYGFDGRVVLFHLDRLNPDDTRKLLHAACRETYDGIVDWIVHKAGGNPGILLLAAKQIDSLRDKSSDFVQQIGKGFEEDIREKFGENALRCTRLISLMTYVGYQGKYESELKHLCKAFNVTLDDRFHDSLQRIQHSGLITQSGSFLSISIPLLGEYFTRQQCQRYPDKILTLLALLEPSGQKRFLERLCEVPEMDIQSFWDNFFHPNDGFLKDYDAVRKNSYLLSTLSQAIPQRIVRLLKDGLERQSVEERQADVDCRRDIMWAIENLLFYKETCCDAIEILLLLAEAENESRYSNNATGVFVECFHHVHPQLPISIDQRINLIKKFVNEDRSSKQKCIVVEAISKAFERFFSCSHRVCKGQKPYNSPPKISWGEYYQYQEEILGILKKLAHSESVIAKDALLVLPRYITSLSLMSPERTYEREFEILTDWCLSKKKNIDIAHLRNQIQWVHDRNKNSNKNSFLDEQLSRFDQSFESHLKHCVGRWRTSNHEEHEKEIQELAQQAINNPNLLTQELIEWLSTDAAKLGYLYVFFLAQHDSNIQFLPLFLKHNQENSSNRLFLKYFCGLAKNRNEAAKSVWLDLYKNNKIENVHLVECATFLHPNPKILNIVINTISSEYTQNNKYKEFDFFPWIDEISSDNFHQLISAIMQVCDKDTIQIIRLLSNWLYRKREWDEPLHEMAWKSLEICESKSSEALDHHEIACVISYLTKHNPKRGFALFEKLLTHYSQNYNESSQALINATLTFYDESTFFNTLRELDPFQFYQTIIDCSKNNDALHVRFSFLLNEYILLERDYEALTDLAKKNIENAREIAQWITSKDQMFETFVNEILPIYPYDENLRKYFSYGFEQFNTIITGPHSLFMQERLEQINRWYENPDTPQAVRDWLDEMKQHFVRGQKASEIWEYDTNIDDLRGYINDKNSDMRMWAIGRVLRDFKWEDAMTMIDPEDIAEALPHINLPESKRSIIEKCIPVWRNDV